MRRKCSDRDWHGAKAATCDGKDQLTFEQAQSIVKRAAGEKRRFRKTQKYKCSFCGHWHIGTRGRHRRRQG